MMEILKQKSTIKGIIAVAAAITMYFTPDHIDQIIEIGLSAYGIENILNDDK